MKVAAERARTTAIDNLTALLVVVRGSGAADEARAKQLELLIEEVSNIRRGAFNSILQQPAVSASLLGALALLQYFLPV